MDGGKKSEVRSEAAQMFKMRWTEETVPVKQLCDMWLLIIQLHYIHVISRRSVIPNCLSVFLPGSQSAINVAW